MKNLLKLHENLVIFPLKFSQDFNGFWFHSVSELLNKGQIRDLARAHGDGSDMLFKITQKQVGNGIGTILASIGIPMILDAFKGMSGRGGPRMGKTGGAGLRIGMPMYPPPYIGTWPSTSGRGKKKRPEGKVYY